jgi:hypothetical protein
MASYLRPRAHCYRLTVNLTTASGRNGGGVLEAEATDLQARIGHLVTVAYALICCLVGAWALRVPNRKETCCFWPDAVVTSISGC